MLLTAVLAVAAAGLASASALLLAWALAALLPARPRPRPGQMATRFAVVVPAHNEEQLLPRLLASIRAQDYDPSRFSTHVIADNCSDATAEVAGSLGATVHVRHRPDDPGKGQAIRWLLESGALPAADALVFLDADSMIEPGFLTAADAYVSREPHLAFQADYRVDLSNRGPLVSLRAIAFALMHRMRGRAKDRLGLSCGLWGNGMVMPRAVIDLVRWGSMSAVEDAEQHLKLLLAGRRVRFMGATAVSGYMPATFAAALGQHRRWEAGRLSLVRRYSPAVLRHSLRRRDFLPLAALLELALPPLSVLAVANGLLLALAILAGAPSLILLSALSMAALVAHACLGLLRAGLPWQTYASLVHAPRLIAWKVWLYARELLVRRDPAWTRTDREPGVQ